MEIEDVFKFADAIKFTAEDRKIMNDILELRKYERMLTVYRTRMRPGHIAKATNLVLKNYNKLYKGKILCEKDEDYKEAIYNMIEHIEERIDKNIINKITAKMLEDYKWTAIESDSYRCAF